MLLLLAKELGLLREEKDYFLVSTPVLKKWKRLSLKDKIKDLFQVLTSGKLSKEESFHFPRIKKICLSLMAQLKPGKWYDSHFLPFHSRNRYLSLLDQRNIKQLYQNHRHYSSQPPRFGPDDMAHRIQFFLIERLFPLGVVDLGMTGRKINAIRLSPLGTNVLGRKTRKKKAGPSLIVTPDFELVLLPEETDLDFLYFVHQCSRRIRSERVYQFKISAETVHEAVSRGLSGEEILKVLKKNSKNPLPQNVEFSIREWASQVTFIRSEKVVLLWGSDSQAVDRILSSGIVKELSPERISDKVLAIRSEISDKIRKEMENFGIYIEEEA
jgi:hypothetical protein